MTFRQLGTPSSTPAKVVLFDVPLPVPADLEGHRREMLASLAWIECDGATQWMEYVSLGLASALQANRYTRKSLRAVDRLVKERLRAHTIVSKMVLVRMLLCWKHTAVQKDGFEQQEANRFRQALEKLIENIDPQFITVSYFADEELDSDEIPKRLMAEKMTGGFKHSLSRPLCSGFESLVDGLSVRF